MDRTEGARYYRQGIIMTVELLKAYEKAGKSLSEAILIIESAIPTSEELVSFSGRVLGDATNNETRES